MAALLTRLQEEIEGGLLTTIENHAIAVTFDDFLDHGAEYLKHGRKGEAAVIAGIVFEDTIRRICRVLAVPENGVALETLISELAKRDPPIEGEAGSGTWCRRTGRSRRDQLHRHALTLFGTLLDVEDCLVRLVDPFRLGRVRVKQAPSKTRRQKKLADVACNVSMSAASATSRGD
jgi:hypothetical protein